MLCIYYIMPTSTHLLTLQVSINKVYVKMPNISKNGNSLSLRTYIRPSRGYVINSYLINNLPMKLRNILFMILIPFLYFYAT